MTSVDTPNQPRPASCPSCWKPLSFCLCTEIREFTPKLRFLILQHPQERRDPLGSARLLSLSLPNTVHRVGLSWPSLAKALGEPTQASEWAVLFLGALKEVKQFREDLPLQIIGRNGKAMAPKGLKGIVLLDGNWKQSKTLWWRNPWLLRLQRAVLNTGSASQYGPVRKQPRKHCLSTLESAAESLAAMGEDPEIPTALKTLFQKFVANASLVGNRQSVVEPPPQSL